MDFSIIIVLNIEGCISELEVKFAANLKLAYQ